jgi:hypothetical protein
MLPIHGHWIPGPEYHRRQVLVHPCSVEELLPDDYHPRTVWTLGSSWNVSLYQTLSIPRRRVSWGPISFE